MCVYDRVQTLPSVWKLKTLFRGHVVGRIVRVLIGYVRREDGDRARLQLCEVRVGV